MIYELVFILFSFIILFIRFGYGPLLSSLVRKKDFNRLRKLPKVTVIVPAYNEEENIESKLRNLLSSEYPKSRMSVIVVDGKSKDNTVKLAKKFPVKVLVAPFGKINGINLGLKHAKTDIVVITDADTLLNKKAIKEAVSILKDDIGGVSGTIRVQKKRFFYINGKLDYHDKDWKTRHKEGLLDSACSLDGKMLAFRKSIVEKIPKESYVDDFELTLLIRKAGYRCVINDKCILYEHVEPGFWKELKQMRRRIWLTILTTFRHVDMVFNPKYGYYGMLILPVRRLLTLFLPFFMLYCGVYLVKFYPLVFDGLVVLLFSLMIVFINKLFYNFILLLSIILAWFDVFLKEETTGAKWKRN